MVVDLCYLFQKIGLEGVVTKLHPPGTVGLRLGKVVFRLNPAALIKVYQHSLGDLVLLRDDLYLLRVLNERIGWKSSMDRVSELCDQLSSDFIPLFLITASPSSPIRVVFSIRRVYRQLPVVGINTS